MMTLNNFYKNKRIVFQRVKFFFKNQEVWNLVKEHLFLHFKNFYRSHLNFPVNNPRSNLARIALESQGRSYLKFFKCFKHKPSLNTLFLSELFRRKVTSVEWYLTMILYLPSCIFNFELYDTEISFYLSRLDSTLGRSTHCEHLQPDTLLQSLFVWKLPRYFVCRERENRGEEEAWNWHNKIFIWWYFHQMVFMLISTKIVREFYIVKILIFFLLFK